MQNPLFSKGSSNSSVAAQSIAGKLEKAVLPWKVALIDDEDDVIAVSEMVLKRLEVDDRPLEVLKSPLGKRSSSIV